MAGLVPAIHVFLRCGTIDVDAILEEANLVSTIRHGREKLHYLNPVPIHEIGERWIKKFERGKLTALSALKKRLEKRNE
jgi:hypothetical protein